MKKIYNKFIAVILLNQIILPQMSAEAGESIPNVSIDCTESTCSPNFTVIRNDSRGTYNAITVGGNNANISVNGTNGKEPRSLKLSILNGAFPDGVLNPGYDLNVDLSSTTSTSKSGDFVLIGDNFKNLNIKLNGYNGKSGNDASKICADNIKKNLYGSDSLAFFNNFRLNNPTVSQDSCVIDDINFIQANKFKCDSGFSEVVTSNGIYSVNVQRIPQVARCQTSLTYDVCLKKKTQLTCNWTIHSDEAFFTGGVVSNSNQITSAYTFKGDLTVGNQWISTTSNLSNVRIGQIVIGNGIPANSSIIEINGSSVKISFAPTISANSVPILAGISSGQYINALGVPVGTKIDSILGTTITMSNNSNTTNTALSFSSSTKTEYGTSINRIIPENQYNYFKNIMSTEDICNLHVAREISDPSYSTPSGVVNPLYSNANSYAGCNGSCQWKVSGLISNLTTPGLNNDETLSLGSDWEIQATTPGQSCDMSTNVISGFWSTYKTVTVNYVAYDVTDTSCKASDIVTFNGGTVLYDYPAQALDPNKKATWFYTGIAQEPDFGTEVIQCDLGNCPLNSIVSDLNQVMDTISPQNGEDGTQQGNGLILIYDAQNFTSSATIGTAGAGGKNNIINQSSTRVCAKIRDAQSDGLGSNYSRSPLINFNRYNWSAIKTNSSGNPGQQPVNLGGNITIWKKIDSSVRSFLQNELFNL